MADIWIRRIIKSDQATVKLFQLPGGRYSFLSVSRTVDYEVKRCQVCMCANFMDVPLCVCVRI